MKSEAIIMSLSTSRKLRFIHIVIAVAFAFVLTACSGSETRAWIEQTFGFTVTVRAETVTTPNGTIVPVGEWVSGDYIPAQAAELDNYSKWGPGGVFRHSPGNRPYGDVSSFKYYN
jgi:hypothetical protein